LVESLIFIDTLSNLNSVKKQILDIKNKKIISFNYDTHNFLEQENIPHTNSDEYLSQNERTQLFDKVASLHNWYEKNKIFQELKFEGTNLLGLMDTAEFSRFLIEKLIKFLTLIRIIQNENPKKIFSSIKNFPAINSITCNSNMELIELKINSNDVIYWNKINFRFHLFSKSFSLGLSQKKYTSIKHHVENFFTFILQLNPNRSKTKSLLFLEFDIGKYSEIIQNLHDYDGQILFLNRRRPTFYDLNTLNLLKKFNCKVLNTKNLTRSNTNLIKTLTKEYSDIFDSVWQNNKIFNEIFSLEGFSFWPYIKNILLESYKSRMTEYFETILASKKILKNFNVSCIVSLNVIGETEKIILDVNNNDIPSIMLEHGYANYIPEISRYDFWSMYNLFKDKIAVWGDVQKQYLINQHKIDEKQILTVGSPRHDAFFLKKIYKSNQKTLLLTMHPLSNIVGQDTISHYIKYEKTIIDFCKIIKNIPELKLIVKLHPSDVPHNTLILNIFNKIDPSIPVFQNKSIMELLLSCDTLVNISPEGWDPSTVMMEALILKIPVMNIILDNLFYNFQYVKDKAIVSLSGDFDLENNLMEILFNKEFRNELIKNGQKHLKNYLSNPGSASCNFAKILKTY